MLVSLHDSMMKMIFLPENVFPIPLQYQLAALRNVFPHSIIYFSHVIMYDNNFLPSNSYPFYYMPASFHD